MPFRVGDGRLARPGASLTAAGRGARAYVARAGCAAAAAAALTGGGHDGRTYDVAGPGLVDADGYAALPEATGGRLLPPTRVGDVTYEEYRTAFMADPATSRTPSC
jgi:NAD(P)H dehydrogenase (quinone)